MEEFSNISTLFENLEQSINQLNKLIATEKDDYLNLVNKTAEEKKVCEEIISGKSELEKILNECANDVCQYKMEFEAIRERNSDKVQNYISGQRFHFFLCYREIYSGQSEKGVIKSHQELIEKNGFFWWGKFIKERVAGGNYRTLEPFGESIKTGEGGSVVFKIKEKVDAMLRDGDNVYLYNYNPNPPNIKLHVCNVVDFYYGQEKIPYQENFNLIPPQCAYIPQYCFHRRDGNCISCNKIDPKRCQPKFLCNFWFKIDRIKELEPVEDEFANLVNCFSEDSINFAIPILYPLLVRQKIEKSYFQELVNPIPNKSGFALDIPSKESGHTKSKEVRQFFNDLNRNCGECFVRVKLIDCPRVYSGRPQLHTSGENDEIKIYLPPTFRIDGKASQFIICLDKKTNIAQKEKVEKMIKDNIK